MLLQRHGPARLVVVEEMRAQADAELAVVRHREALDRLLDYLAPSVPSGPVPAGQLRHCLDATGQGSTRVFEYRKGPPRPVQHCELGLAGPVGVPQRHGVP